ncbi:MAG: hypothetical protein N2053_03920 [Chitinispirillaceae bacterium]|nr:hypothetical protein [Chitinispirillaceae bacterium]
MEKGQNILSEYYFIKKMDTKKELRNKTGIKICLSVIFILVFTTYSSTYYPYIELIPTFNRINSKIIARKITEPTMSNLDFAAYNQNPLLFEAYLKNKKVNLKRQQIEEFKTKGFFKEIVDNIEEIKFSSTSKVIPIAWSPFLRRCWNIVKNNYLQEISSKINSYKWGIKGEAYNLQEITILYINNIETYPEFWVKIEFMPNVKFTPQLSDEDKDGFTEIYGKINTDLMPSDSLEKIVSWIKNDYTIRVLTDEQIKDWATELVSYWYPIFNTDFMELKEDGSLPLLSIEKKIIKTLSSCKITTPSFIIEGKPNGSDKPFYNVFIIERKEQLYRNTAISKDLPQSKIGEITEVVLSENYRQNNIIFSNEIAIYGSYRKWVEKNEPFYNSVRKWLQSFPEEQLSLEGKEGWLFFRKSFGYIFSEDLSLQIERYNPLPHIVEFKNYLNSIGIDLLFVIVPTKEEIYYEFFSDSTKDPEIPLIATYGRKFMFDLQLAGVEVIDLLSNFLKVKFKWKKDNKYLYQKQDTHWSGEGIKVAASIIAERIKRFSWYKNYNDTVSYFSKDTIVLRLGDLVEKLPEEKKFLYKPDSLKVQQVYNPDNSLYKGELPTAPILLIGDSFTGVFELIDCKGAGIGANIAYFTRIPVDIITSWGGGPMVRQKMLRTRGKLLSYKKIVIYMMSARDLYHYSQGWDPLLLGN